MEQECDTTRARDIVDPCSSLSLATSSLESCDHGSSLCRLYSRYRTPVGHIEELGGLGSTRHKTLIWNANDRTEIEARTGSALTLAA